MEFNLNPLEYQRIRSYQNSYQTHFKVTTSQDDLISMSVVMPEMQRKVKQASEVLLVKLLNQLATPVSRQLYDYGSDYLLSQMTHSFSLMMFSYSFSYLMEK